MRECLSEMDEACDIGVGMGGLGVHLEPVMGVRNSSL